MTAHRPPRQGNGRGRVEYRPPSRRESRPKKFSPCWGAYADEGLGMRPTEKGLIVPMRMSEPLLHATQPTLIVALRWASLEARIMDGHL